jgi:hypothetical protein
MNALLMTVTPDDDHPDMLWVCGEDTDADFGMPQS